MCVYEWMSECTVYALHSHSHSHFGVRFAYIFIYIFLFNKFNLLWVSFGCLYACLLACLLGHYTWVFSVIPFQHFFARVLSVPAYISVFIRQLRMRIEQREKTTTTITTTITATAAVTLASFSLNSTLYTLYLPLSCTSFDVDTGPCYVFTVLCVLNSSKSQIYWKHINKRYTLLSVYMPYTLYIYTYDIAKRTRKTRSASVLPSNILNRIIYKRAVCAFSIFIFLCFLLFRLLFSVVILFCFFISFHVLCVLYKFVFQWVVFTHSSAFRFLL